MESQTNYITFGAQMGDRYADNAVAPNLRELKGLLNKILQQNLLHRCR